MESGLSEMDWNFSRIQEVFSFKYDPETAFLFTKVEFWIFLTALSLVYVFLQANVYVRLMVTSTVALLTSWFFKNGDFIVAGLMLFVIYNGIHQIVIQKDKKRWLALLIVVGLCALGSYYFYFKTITDRIYFNVEPIDIWLLILLVLFLLSYFKKQVWVRSLFLSIISFYFYFKSAEKLVILLAGSVFINYYLARWINCVKEKASGKWVLGLAVGLNILMLGYFKYTYFFASAYNDIAGTNWLPTNIFAEFGNW